MEKNDEEMHDEFRLIENQFIVLPDDTRLSCRLWLPLGADKHHKVPAILEFLPYRKRDITTYRDEITYPYFASKGYAGVRVDMRGCGDSTGQVQDEYVRQEQIDAVHVIDWISRQDWCTGNVGMMGISWGGFNSLQVAAEQPEALKAVIAICFTDDRYNNDIHYKGGVMFMDRLRWAAGMEVRNALPPDPLFTTDWLKTWVSRMESSPPLVHLWLSHTLRDAYYKHGSVCEDYSLLFKTPALLIGGYADGYTNSVMSTLDALPTDTGKALIGPWVHLYPHIASPEPLWDFCKEAVQWWDRWLSGKSASPAGGTRLTAFIQDGSRTPRENFVAGKWVTDPATQKEVFYLKEHQLGGEKGNEHVTVCSKQTVGMATCGMFFPTTLKDMPGDQQIDDSISYVYDTMPFTEDKEYFGSAVLKLRVASNKTVANVFARLCIVQPSGVSCRVAYNACNLNHDEKHESYQDLMPGRFHNVTIVMDCIGEKIQRGCRLRLALSSAYYPMFLPTPESVSLTIDEDGSYLEMQLMSNAQEISAPPTNPVNRSPFPYNITPPSQANCTRQLSIDGSDGLHTCTTIFNSGKKTYTRHGLTTEWREECIESILPDDPCSAKQEIIHHVNWSRENWNVQLCYKLCLTMDVDNLYTEEFKTATANGEVHMEKKRKNTFARKSKDF